MEFIHRSQLSTSEREEILAIWNQEYPEKLAYKRLSDFEKYLDQLKDQHHILVVNEQQHIQGWLFVFTRENERWFAIILDSSVHGLGVGTQLLNRIKKQEPELNGWVLKNTDLPKINGETYNPPLPFYLKNGFQLWPTQSESQRITALKIRWKHTS